MTYSISITHRGYFALLPDGSQVGPYQRIELLEIDMLRLAAEVNKRSE